MLKGKYHFEVFWSEEDGEYVARCHEFPSLSWLGDNPLTALGGLHGLLRATEEDMEKNGEILPTMVEP